MSISWMILNDLEWCAYIISSMWNLCYGNGGWVDPAREPVGKRLVPCLPGPVWIHGCGRAGQLGRAAGDQAARGFEVPDFMAKGRTQNSKRGVSIQPVRELSLLLECLARLRNRRLNAKVENPNRMRPEFPVTLNSSRLINCTPTADLRGSVQWAATNLFQRLGLYQ
jgi:hypothetical protein